MRKSRLALAALAIIAVVAPTIVSAEDRVGGDHFGDRDGFRRAHAEFLDHDRGFHRGWDRGRGDRTVIIKRHHHGWD